MQSAICGAAVERRSGGSLSPFVINPNKLFSVLCHDLIQINGCSAEADIL
jgi:hypothetical protein